MKGSRWTISLIRQYQFAISEVTPCEENSYFSSINPMKRLVNIQNGENQFSRWCLVR